MNGQHLSLSLSHSPVRGTALVYRLVVSARVVLCQLVLRCWQLVAAPESVGNQVQTLASIVRQAASHSQLTGPVAPSTRNCRPGSSAPRSASFVVSLALFALGSRFGVRAFSVRTLALAPWRVLAVCAQQIIAFFFFFVFASSSARRALAASASLSFFLSLVLAVWQLAVDESNSNTTDKSVGNGLRRQCNKGNLQRQPPRQPLGAIESMNGERDERGQ